MCVCAFVRECVYVHMCVCVCVCVRVRRRGSSTSATKISIWRHHSSFEQHHSCWFGTSLKVYMYCVWTFPLRLLHTFHLRCIHIASASHSHQCGTSLKMYIYYLWTFPLRLLDTFHLRSCIHIASASHSRRCGSSLKVCIYCLCIFSLRCTYIYPWRWIYFCWDYHSHRFGPSLTVTLFRLLRWHCLSIFPLRCTYCLGVFPLRCKYLCPLKVFIHHLMFYTTPLTPIWPVPKGGLIWVYFP